MAGDGAEVAGIGRTVGAIVGSRSGVALAVAATVGSGDGATLVAVGVDVTRRIARVSDGFGVAVLVGVRVGIVLGVAVAVAVGSNVGIAVGRGVGELSEQAETHASTKNATIVAGTFLRIRIINLLPPQGLSQDSPKPARRECSN